MAHYLSYWTPQNAHWDEGRVFDYAWNSRYEKVKPNDVIWLVTTEKRVEGNNLILLAQGVVAEVMVQSKAKHHSFFEGKTNWPEASKWPIYWIITKEPRMKLTRINITPIAFDLRFEGKNSTLFENPAKWGNALQTLRTLTSESAKLLETRLQIAVGGDMPVLNQELETTEEEIARIEGKEILRSHLQRERLAFFRDQKLRMSMKPYQCEACEMTFEERYGEIGKDFIEVHHKTAIADGERETKLEDLALLCSNCHRMIHKSGNLSDIESFRKNHLTKV